MKTNLEYLENFCDELTPKEFYRVIFPKGELERKGEYVFGKYNAIIVTMYPDTKKFKKRFTVTDDLDKVDEVCASDDFCVMAPVSYAGRKRKNQNARFLYAMAIDLDGLRVGKNSEKYEYPEGIETLFYQFDGNGPSNYLPKPTMIVYSGTGLHIYYVFEKPIPCFRNIVKQLEKLKKRLTWQLWTQGVSDLVDRVQDESLFQPFRMPGTITKAGGRARAFVVGNGDKVSVEYLNQFVPPEHRTIDFTYKSDLTLAQAKEKYPEWYEKRIIQKQPKGTWCANRALYDWWKRKILNEAKDGGRYWAIFALAVYAKKCGVDYSELKEDAFGFVEYLNSIGQRTDNPFTDEDVVKALEAYNDDYITYPRKVIAARSMIDIPKNKRNGRKQEAHLYLARRKKEDMKHLGEEIKDGRPKGSGTAAQKVYEWRQTHADGKKIECERETGLSRPTVLKWWDWQPPKFTHDEGGNIVVKFPHYLSMTNEEIQAEMKREFEKWERQLSK